MDQKHHTAGCQPHGDQILCIDPPQCFKPAQWVCNPHGTLSCRCEVPVTNQPGRLCTASVVYTEHAPTNPTLVPMEAHCGAAGVEVALAVMLAKLLGAP